MRSLAGWCGVVLCLAASSLLAASPAGAVAGYGDVAEGRYYTEPVQWSVDNDLTGIDGNCFGPDAPVSRGEAAVYIWNMEGQPSAPAHSFVDVTVESQDAAVSWMSHNEITTGTSPTTFGPDTALTRAHLVTFLWRLADEPAAPDHSFVDVHASWQQGSVSWAADREITTGTSPTTFDPDGTLTRAHLVTFLYRYQGEPEVMVDPASPDCETFQTVSAGSSHSCGLRTDNTLTCWSGNNVDNKADAPSGAFQTVSAGESHSCGLGADNTITCWGSNYGGEADAPAGVFQAVSAGSYHSCGLRADNTVTCWGDNWDGQVDAPGGAFQAVSAGSNYSCGLRADNTVTCWGRNHDGRADAPGGAFQTVSAGGNHSCGLRADNTVTCWGDNIDGQVDAPGGAFQTVSTGSSHSCGLRADNTVICWGFNRGGQVDAPGGAFQTVSAGGGHSCGLRADNTVTCWGGNVWSGEGG